MVDGIKDYVPTVDPDKEQRNKMIELLKNAEANIAFVAGALSVTRDHQEDSLSLIEALGPVRNTLTSLKKGLDGA